MCASKVPAVIGSRQQVTRTTTSESVTRRDGVKKITLQVLQLSEKRVTDAKLQYDCSTTKESREKHEQATTNFLEILAKINLDVIEHTELRARITSYRQLLCEDNFSNTRKEYQAIVNIIQKTSHTRSI